MTRLSAIDGGFLLTETQESPKHVGGLQIFRLPKGKGPAWLRSMLDEMRKAPPTFPFDQRIKSRMGVVYELETDDRFEIDYHVRHTVLPRPGSEQQLVDVVSRIHANLLDRDRPLWEFHLVEGLSDRRFALYLKVHHALADGITIGRWYDRTGSFDPKTKAMCPIWACAGSPPEDPGFRFDPARLIAEGLDFLGEGVRTATGLATLAGKFVKRRFLEGDRRIALPLSAPRTSINVKPGAARKVSFTAYRLEDLRAIGKSQGGSINDVVMTLCDIALCRYFQDHGDSPEGPLVAYMPVNVRTEEEDGEGNLVTLLQVKLASEHRDAVTSLNEVRESIITARELYSGATRSVLQYYALVVALVSLFEETFKLNRLLHPVDNLVISNVPGARKTMYLNGAEQLAIFPVSTLPPMTALNVTACSYAGDMYFGLIAARSVVPDLDVLTSYMDDAFLELAEGTGVDVTPPWSVD